MLTSPAKAPSTGSGTGDGALAGMGTPAAESAPTARAALLSATTCRRDMDRSRTISIGLISMMGSFRIASQLNVTGAARAIRERASKRSALSIAMHPVPWTQVQLEG